jgi:hypothetical protein
MTVTGGFDYFELKLVPDLDLTQVSIREAYVDATQEQMYIDYATLGSRYGKFLEEIE